MSAPASPLAFERDAILAGEWWRALTGQWLHATAAQSAWNFAAALAAGAVLWRLAGARRCAVVFAAGHAAAALTVLLLLPEWHSYSGLSGVAAALAGAAIAAALGEGSPALRRSALAALALLGVKLFLEAAGRTPVFARTPGAVTDWKIHAVPALTGAGIMLALAGAQPRHKRRDGTEPIR